MIEGDVLSFLVNYVDRTDTRNILGKMHGDRLGRGRGTGCDGEGEWGNEERGVGRLIEIGVVVCYSCIKGNLAGYLHT